MYHEVCLLICQELLMLLVALLNFSLFSVFHYNRHCKIRVPWLCVECCCDGNEETRNSCLCEYRYLSTDINIALLKGSKEGSDTAGTAAVNMAANRNAASWEGGNAAALCIFTLVYLDLGTDFPRLASLIPNAFPSLCSLKWAFVGALRALPCRLSFHVSHFSDLSHKGTINFVKEIGGTSSLFLEIEKQEKRRGTVLKVLNNSLSLWEKEIGSDRGK